MIQSNVSGVALSELRKFRGRHMWYLSKDTTGAYLVTVGSPTQSGSVIKARFSGAEGLQELRLWVKHDMVSEDHVVDETCLGLVPENYTRWYVENILLSG